MINQIIKLHDQKDQRLSKKLLKYIYINLNLKKKTRGTSILQSNKSYANINGTILGARKINLSIFFLKHAYKRNKQRNIKLDNEKSYFVDNAEPPQYLRVIYATLN